MPFFGFTLPSVWIKVRELLEQARAPGIDHIPYEGYIKLCNKHGMTEDRALFLSEFFHDIGVFLHFRDDLTLRDTIFLNHEWVTDGVYKVLDNEHVKAHYGHFTDDDLVEIWKEEKYKEKRKELLALMKNRKFELCYELPGGGYLAPNLLPVDEQPYEWRSHQDNLHFEYSYQFMPKGILTRFIVRRHKDIFQQTHWRYGVLLDYDNTRALVRERYFERKLTIMLEGSNKKGFLEIIRKTIHELHDSYNNLAAEEMIPCNCALCRGSQQPHFYRYALLQRYWQNGRPAITCEQSLDDVRIETLIHDVFPQSSVDAALTRDRDIHIHIGDKIGGDKIDATVGAEANNVVVGKDVTQGSH